MKLQPYLKDRPCPKCGEKGATAEYLPHKGYYRWGSCDKETFVEHLHRHCCNCHYEWCEAPVVSPVNSEGLTPEQVALDG